MRNLALLALLCMPTAAYATSAHMQMNNSTLFIGEEVCKWATAHVPDDDVAYQAGVDGEGNQVAPATVTNQYQGAGEDLFRQINIELTSDIAQQLGIPEKLIEQNLNVGTIEVDDFDRPTINGQPLVDPDPTAWQEACEQSINRN